MFFEVPVYRQFVAHGMQARPGDDHRFGLALYKVSHLPVKVLEHNGHLFGNCLLMPVYKGFEEQGGFGAVVMRVSLDLF